MKAKILLLLVTLIGLVVFESEAQQLITPFPDTNAIWVQQYSDGSNPPNPPESDLYKLYPYNRIIFDSLEYTELRRSISVDYVSLYDYMEGMPSGNTVGYYRVDSSRVYFRGVPLYCDSLWFNYNNNEILLYDFGLSIGDTFNLTNTNKVILDSIDSILINGTYYDKYNFNTTLYPDFSGIDYFWIEGMGSNIGFFPFFYFFEHNMQLWCFYQDYYQIATGPGNEPCYTLNADSEMPLISPKVYPNPAFEFINITSESDNEFEFIELHDLSGKLIFRVPYKNTFQIGNIEPGLYMISLLKSDFYLYTQKIIIAE